MEETRKRPELESMEEVAEKRLKTPAISEDVVRRGDYDDLMAWLSVDDETSSVLAKLLETEISLPIKVKFADDPYSWPLMFQSSSSSYVTINGNEESCGSSFADLDSSVMASVDTTGINIACAKLGIESLLTDEVEEDRKGSSVKGSNGSDCLDYYDEMLARFLGEDILKFQE